MTQSPLHHILSALPAPIHQADLLESTTLALGEKEFQGKVMLIGAGETFRTKAAAVLGFDLPQVPNSMAVGNGITALWLAPKEWLLITAPGAEQNLSADLRHAVRDMHALVTVVSDRWTTLTMTGSQAADTLCKGTSVSIPPDNSDAWCFQTRLFSLPVILRPADDESAYDILVDATFADYLWRCVVHAAGKLPVQIFSPRV